VDQQGFANPGDDDAVGDALATNMSSRHETCPPTSRTSVPSTAWHKSVHSGDSGCVEIAFIEGQVAVRDSKDRGGHMLVFTTTEWTAFISGVLDGQFGLPGRA
jgi:hypothetical protein